MNSQYKLPLVCVACIAGGWFFGYLMGNGPASGGAPDQGGRGVEQFIAGSTGAEATGGEHPRGIAALLNVLRDPNARRGRRVLEDMVEKLSLAEIVEATNMVKRLPQRERDVLLPMLVGRWAESDPVTALKFARILEGKTRSDVLSAALEVWSTADPQAAQVWVQALPPDKFHHAALSSLTSLLTARDPVTALQFLGTLRKDGNTFEAYTELFDQWADQSPVAAARQVLALPPGASREGAVDVTVRRWAQRDPERAIAWAEQLPEAWLRRQTVLAAYRSWVSVDPEAAAAAVLAQPAGTARSEAIGGMVQMLGSENMELAVRLTEQMPAGSARNSTMHNLTQQWAQSNPAAAVQYISTLIPPGDYRTNVLSNLLNEWARVDWPAAVAWLKSSEDSKRILTPIVAVQWSETDPRAAADFLMANKVAPSSAYITMENIMDRWARRDAQPALAYAREISDEKLRDKALAGAIGGLAASDPMAAVGLVAELPTESRSLVCIRIASQWVQTDAPSAAAWSTQLPESGGKSAALHIVASQWARLDPDGAARWLEGLPTGPARDTGVLAFATGAAESDPEIGVAWANTISDVTRRHATLEQIGSRWVRMDPASATTWIPQSPLNAAVRQRLLDQAENSDGTR